MHDDGRRDYEIAVLMAHEADEPSWGENIAIIQKEGPKNVSLAYPIKKHLSATLRVYIIRCLPQAAQALNALLGSSQAIVRHLLITPPIMTRRRMPQSVVRESVPAPQGGLAKPVPPEMVSNKTLEEVLEKILEHNEPQ